LGISKSKTKTKEVATNEPWKEAQPYIIKGMEQANRVFDSQQPALEGYAAEQRDTYGRVAPGAESGILGAQGVVNANLAGDNLMGNPFLQGIIDQTAGEVNNRVSSGFSKAGRYGSGNHAAILARELAAAANAARFNNYAMERGYQQQAIDQAQSLMGGSQSLLNNAAELPWLGVGAMNGNIRQASNGYGTSTRTGTTTSSPNWGPMLMQAAASAAQSAAMASDPRLKENVVLVSTDADGLNWYDFDYRQDMGLALPKGRQRGVMADEVAKLRPWALGPKIRGEYGTVAYSEL
jgi:hypothetical protein